MKLYYIEDVISKLIEDNSLVFENVEDDTLVKLKDNGIRFYDEDGMIKGVYGVSLTTRYKVHQESVSFMDAANAFMNGKDIRCEYKNKTTNTTVIDVFKQSELKGYMRKEDDLTFYMITNGKWYIEEP